MVLPSASTISVTFFTPPSTAWIVVTCRFGAWLHRIIKDLARSRACTGFCRRTGSGVRAVVMRAEVKDGAVVVEDVLSAIAVVIIPIDDQHSADPVSLLQVTGGDRDIIKDT